MSDSKFFGYAYKPSGSSSPHSLHGYTDSIWEQRPSLRHATSLQDFSTYDFQADDDPESDVGRSSSHHALLSPSSLQHQENILKYKVPPKNKWLRVISVFFCLLLLACLCFGLLVLYLDWFRGSSKFFVVIDCGSTGNRVYVYEASFIQEKGYNLPVLLKSLPESFEKKPASQRGKAYNRMETEPGLDKLVHNVSGLKKVIKPLINWAEKQIPEKSHSRTSLFLYATAGVRRLPSSYSDWLLENSWSILKSSSFFCKREWIKIISGVEEAYYGWIALNYHAGVLGSLPRKETFGALDLGGSSLQVTFEGNEKNDEDTSLMLSIGAVKHHLSAYSLAGYGLNDAFDRSVARLVRMLSNVSETDLAKKFNVQHPCLHSGYSEEFSCSHCKSILQHGKGDPAAIPVQVMGTPNWEKCSSLAEIVVNASEWSDNIPATDCDLRPCAFGKDLPHPVGQFYAMSGFYVVYRFFNLTSEASVSDVLAKGREFCQQPWDIALKSVVPQPFIEQYCFRAPYIVQLLRKGLHIDDNRVTIGSGSITWTLGVALSEAGNASSSMGRRNIYSSNLIFRAKMDPYVLLIIFFIVSLFVFFCAFAGKWRISASPRRPYLPLFKNNNAVPSSLLSIPAPFRFQRWSRPISSGDGRAKMPLSPTTGNAPPYFNGGNIQFSESSSSRVPHSYSSGSLRQMQFDCRDMGSFWKQHRSKTRLQSRRSQSREDLSSSLSLHLPNP